MCELTVPEQAIGYKRHRRAGEEACRECLDAYNTASKRWRQSRKSRGINPQIHRWVRYRLKHEEFGIILASQGGLCAICSGPFKGTRDMHVDHDHKCDHAGKGLLCCRSCVRGILCFRCNSSIHILEDEEWLKKAVSYLGKEKGEPRDGYL